MPSGQWRNHSKLKDLFHPESPDNLQVLLHDGDPALTGRKPELLWVRVMDVEGSLFRAQVLDRPRQLMRVREGSLVRFMVPQGGRHPLQVRPGYWKERDQWVIEPCLGCGLTELLEAPNILAHHLCKVKEESLSCFEVVCAVCGEIQRVSRLIQSSEPEVERGWWLFGKRT